MPYIEGWCNEKDTRDTISSTLSYHPERLAHCNSTSHLELLCVTFSSFNFRVWHTNLKMASTDRKFILNFILGTPFQHFLRSYQSHSLSQRLWLSRISGRAKALVRPCSVASTGLQLFFDFFVLGCFNIYGSWYNNTCKDLESSPDTYLSNKKRFTQIHAANLEIIREHHQLAWNFPNGWPFLLIN